MTMDELLDAEPKERRYEIMNRLEKSGYYERELDAAEKRGYNPDMK